MQASRCLGAAALLLLATGGACRRPEATPAPEAAAPAAPATLTAEEATAIATDAYVYGYPLVTMDLTRRVMTNVTEAEGWTAPMGQFANLRTFPDPSLRAVTTPNADTLYSTAWVDVGEEPYVLSVPDMGDRYHLLPMLSMWTDVFASPGTRTSGGGAQTLLITGPRWEGTVPPGMTRVVSPTDTVWILGRTLCSGTPKDYAAVHALQDQLQLVPLSRYGGDFTPPPGQVDPSIDMKTAVRDQVEALDGAAFFTRLAELLAAEPPAEADAPLLERMARIGIVPGRFDPGVAPDAVSAAPAAGLARVAAHAPDAGRDENGWLVTTRAGDYGDDYLQRAYIARIGLGANLPQDAVYPSAAVDAKGETLDGANRYVLHFDAGAEPPVDGFWSVTAYDAAGFFVENPLDRYSLGSRNELARNPDGSVDLYIQAEPPDNGREANWLPVPQGRFNLVMRLYAPEAAVLDGTWTPPGVHRVEGPS